MKKPKLTNLQVAFALPTEMLCRLEQKNSKLRKLGGIRSTRSAAGRDRPKCTGLHSHQCSKRSFQDGSSVFVKKFPHAERFPAEPYAEKVLSRI